MAITIIFVNMEMIKHAFWDIGGCQKSTTRTYVRSPDHIHHLIAEYIVLANSRAFSILKGRVGDDDQKVELEIIIVCIDYMHQDQQICFYLINQSKFIGS